MEDVGVGEEGLVLVAGEDGEAGEDVEVVEVAVAVDEDDAPAAGKALGEDEGGAGTAVGGPEDGDGLGGGHVRIKRVMVE